MSDEIKEVPAVPAAEVTPTPAPAEVTPTPAAPAADLTVESVQDKILAGIMGRHKPEEPKKEEPPKEEPPKDKAKPAAAETPAPAVTDPEAAKPKRKAKPAPAAPTATDIAKVAAAAAVQAVKDSKEQTPTPAPVVVAPPPEIDPQFAKDADIYKYLADSDPKYKNLIPELNEYAKSFREYRKEWQKEHPGEKFDHEDSAHDDWYEANEPKVSDRDIAKASGAVEALRHTAKLDQQEQEKVQNQRVQEITNELTGLAMTARERMAESMIRAIGGESAKGELSLDVVKTVLEAPGAREAMQEQVTFWQPVVDAAAYLMTPQGRLMMDPSNRSHAIVEHVAGILESEMAADESIDDRGRKFVTREEYYAMSPSKQKVHYTLTPDITVGMVNRHAADSIVKSHKNYVAQIEKNAERLGFKRDAAQPTVAKTAQGTPAAVAAVAPVKPTPAAPSTPSVSAPTGGPTITSGAPGPQTAKSGYDLLFEGVMGRRG